MNTPDIDIERLKESLAVLMDDNGCLRLMTRHNADQFPPAIAEVSKAACFLVSLADEGGELWVKKPCPHGLITEHPRVHAALKVTDCPGGSSVRVWPKEDR